LQIPETGELIFLGTLGGLSRKENQVAIL